MRRSILLLCLFLCCQAPGPLRKTGTAYLGVMYAHSNQGVEIVQVLPGSPAMQAGLSIGDTIVAVNGVGVDRGRTLSAAIQAHRPGQRVRLTVVRASGIQEDLEAEIETAPARK